MGIDETREELKAAVLEYVNTTGDNISPGVFFVLTGILDYTFELEKALKENQAEIEALKKGKPVVYETTQ